MKRNSQLLGESLLVNQLPAWQNSNSRCWNYPTDKSVVGPKLGTLLPGGAVMVMNFLRKIFGGETKTSKQPPKNSGTFPDASVTKRRLETTRGRRLEITDSTTTDDLLGRTPLMDENKVRHTSSVNRQAISYWRHTTAAGEIAMNSVPRRTVSRQDYSTPNYTGMDEQNFSAFITTSAKNRALKSYFLKARDQINAPSSNANLYKKAESELFSYVEMESMSGAQEILYNMARDPDVNVRASIAENDHTPAEAMWILLEDESSDVRLKLALNRSCPVPILELLSNDRDRVVAQKASQTLTQIWEVAGEGIATGKLVDATEEEDPGEHLFTEAS